MTRLLTVDPVPPIASASREHSVPCSRCRRVETMHTSGICSNHQTWTRRQRTGDLRPGQLVLQGLTWRNIAAVAHYEDGRTVVEYEAGAVPMIREYDSGDHVRVYTAPIRAEVAA